jgi:hypothetical protein
MIIILYVITDKKKKGNLAKFAFISIWHITKTILKLWIPYNKRFFYKLYTVV